MSANAVLYGRQFARYWTVGGIRQASAPTTQTGQRWRQGLAPYCSTSKPRLFGGSGRTHAAFSKFE